MAQELTAYENLRQLLKEADYDAALQLVLGWDPRTIVANEPDRLKQLRFSCMIADVLDYGGLYSLAEHSIRMVGRKAKKELSNVRTSGDISDPDYLKQLCWALLMWGMSFYRHQNPQQPQANTDDVPQVTAVTESSDFDEAMKLFRRARDIAQMIHESREASCIGTLGRAWYCIGLVERQRHDYRAARKAFKHSIELAGKGIDLRYSKGGSTVSFEYHMARCCGLGIGWIAYNDGQVTEAMGQLVVAQQFMRSKKARFISAYIDLVQASVIVSEATNRDRIDEAIALLQRSCSTFDPEHGLRHVPYTFRVMNALARAYLRRALVGPPSEREQQFMEAERYLNRIEKDAKPKQETNMYCAALITRARIKRERGDFAGALALAVNAKDLGGESKFTRIDACIGKGEAAFGLGNFQAALDEFQEALDVGGGSRKVVAVCHLHLSRAYLASNQPLSALTHFNLWQASEDGFDNVFLADLAAKVRRSLSNVFPDFKISKNDVRTSTEHLNSLRSWLAETAVALENGDEDRASRRLGINKATLKGWLRLGPRPAVLADAADAAGAG
jgi:tetratricopeptide (TPR) repeat protein